MVTLNIYADIEPTPKIQSMLRVAPALRGKSSKAVAVIFVLLTSRLDFGGDTVGERFR